MSIDVKVTKSRRPTRPRPRAPNHEDLLRNVECHLCQRQYGVFAIASYCPDCGGPNLSIHLDREVTLIQAEVESAAALLAEGELERAARRMANAHEDAITATETYLKVVYERVVRARLDEATAEQKLSSVRNAFQNIDRARTLFAEFLFDPFGAMDRDELEHFRVMLSKRHVVTHNLGLADARYVEQVGDGRPGENIKIEVQEIERHCKALQAIILRCQQQLPEFGSGGLP